MEFHVISNSAKGFFLPAESGAVVFAASTGNQYPLEDAKWNNGAFTKALVEGFTGRADY